MTFGMEQETANWFMRTTPRRSRAEDGGSAALSMEVMGRPMGLRYASREDGHRDNLNDRIERGSTKPVDSFKVKNPRTPALISTISFPSRRFTEAECRTTSCAAGCSASSSRSF